MRQPLPDYPCRLPPPGQVDTLAERVARSFLTHSGHLPATLPMPKMGVLARGT